MKPIDLSAVSIRHANENDLLALEWGGEYIHFRNLYANIFQTVLQGNSIMWVAEIPQYGIIGQVFVSLKGVRLELADGYSRAYLFGFRVKDTFRTMGIGTLLHQTVEEDLSRRGFGIITLNVGQDNDAARRLYERLGYRVVAFEPGKWSYFDHLGHKQMVNEPAWRMEKRIHD